MRLWVIALVLTTSACAVGNPQVVKLQPLDTTGSLAPVALQSADSTKSAECAALEEKIAASVQVMANKRALAEKEAAAPPANLVRAMQRAFGPAGAGNAALEDYRRERDRAERTKADLAIKSCAPVDLDARMAQTKPDLEAKPEDGKPASSFGLLPGTL